MSDNNSRLVYTTDEKDPNYQNNEIFDHVIEKGEAEKHMEDEVKGLRSIIPTRKSNGKTRISRNNPIETLRREQELRTFAKLLFEQPTSMWHLINTHFPNKTKNQINDTLQTIKHASKHRIKSIGGLWQFIPAEDDNNITANEFVSQVLQNKSARWKDKAKKRRQKKENPKTFKEMEDETYQKFLTDSSEEKAKEPITIKLPPVNNIVNIPEEKEMHIVIKTNNTTIEINIK